MYKFAVQVTSTGYVIISFLALTTDVSFTEYLLYMAAMTGAGLLLAFIDFLFRRKP